MTKRAVALLVWATLAGCAAAPPAPIVTPSPPVVPRVEPAVPVPAPEREPAPMVEHPPVEPVQPVVPRQAPPPEPEPPAAAPAPAPEALPSTPPSTPPVAALVPAQAPESVEEQQLSALVADLARYSSLPPDEARREVNTVTQTLGRQRTDANRVRLAMLYTLSRAAQDDQRALQLLETVIKSSSAPPGVKQLAGVLHAQITERVRVVREEQQKAAAAIQKLEALRSLERSLLRDRVRGGGGGGAGGGSSGGGGG